MKAFNFITNREYSGNNAQLVGNGKYNAFATFRQIASAGYSVNKGAKSIGVFCGYKTDKNGNNKPVWGRVFDIIDTNAIQDQSMIDFLETVERVPSELQVNQEICASVLGGADGAKQVQNAYKEVKTTKEVSATDFMRSIGVEVVQIA